MLFVRDLARMTTFYEHAFGKGQAVPLLRQIPPGMAERTEVSSPACSREETPPRLVFPVDDLELASARLTAFGAVIVAKRDGAWEGLDPEGNVFQIVSR